MPLPYALPSARFVPLALLLLSLAGAAEAQDVRELQRRVVALESETGEKLVEATSRLQAQERRIQAMERERAELLSEVQLLIRRLSAVEAVTQRGQDTLQERGQVATPPPAPETRGFERVGSVWRFEVGGSFVELDETGIRISGAGDVRLQAGADFTLSAGLRVNLAAGMDLAASSGTQVELRGPGSSSRLLLNAAESSLFGSLVQLGGPSGTPAARLGDPVQVSPQSGGGQVVNGSTRVLVGGH